MQVNTDHIPPSPSPENEIKKDMAVVETYKGLVFDDNKIEKLKRANPS